MVAEVRETRLLQLHAKDDHGIFRRPAGSLAQQSVRGGAVPEGSTGPQLLSAAGYRGSCLEAAGFEKHMRIRALWKALLRSCSLLRKHRRVLT